MAGGDGDPEAVFGDPGAGEARVGGHGPAEPQVAGAGEELVAQLVGEELAHLGLDAPLLRTGPGQQVHHLLRRYRRGVADAQMPGLAPADAPGALQGGVGLGLERAGVVDEGLPGGGGGDVLVAPVQELDADVPLKGADRGAQRLLAEVQPLGRPGEPALLGDGDEVFQLVQVQSHAVRSLP